MTSADLWVLSNGVGAIAFALLTLLLIVGLFRRPETILLIVVCAINMLWCGLLTVAPWTGVSATVLDLAETMRDGAWLVFIAWLLPVARLARFAATLRVVAVVLPMAFACFFVWRLATGSGVDPINHRSAVFAMGATLMALLGIVLIEQLYRDADDEARWGLKYLCLAVTTLFAYDFLMYSYALLYQRIDLIAWAVRGVANALVVPLIAISVGRTAMWSPQLRLSQQATFKTTGMIACGGYLVVSVLIGYYIRNFGGTWAQAAAVLFFVGTALVFAVLLLSGQVRARARVLVKKHFFTYKYDYRAEWLGLTARLSQGDETSDPYQRSIRAVAHIMESPGGALWLAREGVCVCAAHWNMPAAETVLEPADSPFVEFLRERRWIVDIDEYHRNPSHYGGLMLPEGLSAIPRARLLLPLFSPQGLLGFMLLAVPRAQTRLTWEDFDLLKTLGTQVGSFLWQQESYQSLAQARQFDAFNQLTAFLMHDLKNIASQQTLLVQNAQKHKTNPEFIDDMVMTVDSSVRRMKRLLEQLQRTTPAQDHTRRVVVQRILGDVVAELKANRPSPVLAGDAADACIRVDPDRFTAVLGHVIRNAQQATPPHGNVTVELRADTAWVRIAVIDNGEGMTPTFIRESLFKPFYTTKSTRGMGIGAYQARHFARAAGGDVDVVSVPDKGTTFTLVLPRAEPVCADPVHTPTPQFSS